MNTLKDMTTHVMVSTEKGAIGFRVWNSHVLDDMLTLYRMHAGSAYLTLTVFSHEPGCDDWTFDLHEVQPCT